jgi:TonB-linked SusC/RagA family outer membrane protein
MILHLLLPYDLKLIVKKQKQRLFASRTWFYNDLTSKFFFPNQKGKAFSFAFILLFFTVSGYSQTIQDTIPATEEVTTDSISITGKVEEQPEEGTLVVGYVRDENTGLPVPDAVVVIKGTVDGSTTDSAGKFSFSTPQKYPITLVVTYDGEFQEVELAEAPDKPIEVKYKPVVVQDKVVIVGYGSKKNKELVGSVAQINPEEIQKIPVASFDAQLQGKASGVQVNSQNGIPGDAVVVRVRGASSINASADPLYIVDGVFVNNQSLSRVDLGGKATSPMADINPSDIESIEVLKDASSTAIYGSRGANGVIIVTTKRGKFEQKPRVTFNSLQGFAWANKNRLWDLTTGPEHATLVNEAWINSGIDNPALNQTYANRPFRPANEIINGVPGRGNPEDQQTYDRLGDLFRSARLQSYDLGVQGGTKESRYFLGGSYTKQEAIIRPVVYERASFKINYDQKINRKVSVGTSNILSYSFRNQVRAGTGTGTGIFQSALHTPTYQPKTNPDGTPSKQSPFDNLEVLLNDVDIETRSLRYIGNVFGQVDITPDLKFRSTWSLDYNNYDEYEYNTSRTLKGASTNGYAFSSITQNNAWMNEQTLSYKKTLGENHNLGGLIGNTIQSNTLKYTSAEGTGFPNNSYTQISSAGVRTANQGWTKATLASFFARADYNYNKKYFVEATIRTDGSSKFGENNRWGYFPSVGAAWRVSEENFMDDANAISDLKIRTSYGVLGNQNGINDFAAQGLWTGGVNYPNTSGSTDQPGTGPFQLANPDLKWEKTKQFDAGLDIAFFKGRLGVATDFYYKYTTDLLIPQQVAATTGFSSYMVNDGELSNKGIELAISSVNIKTKNFDWRTSFNFTRNVNKVEKLATPFIYGSRDMIRNEEGYELYSFWMYKQLYVDPKTGAAVFEDVNGDGKITVADRQIMGSANPDFFGGITNNFKFKGFDLGIFFAYQYGNKVVSFDRILNEGGGTKDNNRAIFANNLDRWQNEGDITDVPRVTSVGNNYGIEQNSRFLEDASFIRLKTLTLGYTLPKSVTTTLNVESLRVYATGGNLLLFTKYIGPDPEANHTAEQNARGIDVGTPPQPTSLQFGLNITL